jgi:hypothetical protein
MLRDNLLVMIGGLLFLPTLPHLLAVGMGTAKRRRHLATRGAFAFTLTIFLLMGCSALTAAVVHGPMKFNGFLPPAAAAIVGRRGRGQRACLTR